MRRKMFVATCYLVAALSLLNFRSRSLKVRKNDVMSKLTQCCIAILELDRQLLRMSVHTNKLLIQGTGRFICLTRSAIFYEKLNPS